jgi:hypothetical protein
MTINTITNKGTRLYQKEEMNFHQGSVTTRDGKKREGFVALRPYDNNYYGVYYAAKADDPLELIPMPEITSIVQDIDLVEAYGDAPAAPVPNTNINGYIVQTDGTRFDGTVKLVGDNGWWVKSIEFTDKESNTIKYGDVDGSIAYCVVNDAMYVQSETVFMKTDQVGKPFAMYSDPYPKSGMSTFAMGFAGMVAGEVVGMAVADAQRGGLDLSNVEMGGQKMGGAAEPIKMYDENGNVSGMIPRTNAQNIISGSVSGMVFKGLQDAEAKKARKEGPKKDEKKFYIYNSDTRENRKGDDLTFEVYLEGCMSYHGLPKAEQKKLQEDSKAAVAYLNTCFSKTKK